VKMETMDKKQLALIGAAVLFLLLSGIFFFGNRSLRSDLKQERITSEALLSEKLMMEKSLARANQDLRALQGSNEKLEKQIAGINREIEEKEDRLKRLTADNSALRRTASRVKEMEASIEKLNGELASLNTRLADLRAESERHRLSSHELQAKIDAMNREREQMNTANTILRAMAGNNYRVEAVRGRNEKLTVNARRTQKLIYSFDLPGDVPANLSFTIKTPDNKKFNSSGSHLASIIVTENSNNFFASTAVLGKTGTRNVEMIYTPEERLQKGLYEFEVFNNNNYIGTTRLRLR
jgi:myosin heavy subunit